MNETALKERIKVVAKEKGIKFNEAWKQLLLERFLARLSKSDYQDKFIFKGGLLLTQYLSIGRETMDADFLVTKIKSEAPVIEDAMKEIAVVDIQDGFLFTWSSIQVLDQPHMDYPGFRLRFEVNFGNMRDKIQIDLGVGDLVNPLKNNFEPFQYKGKPIFEGEISLYVYPVETIFAEKLETIILKNTFNSRMKDYHDVILMTREPDLIKVEKLKSSIKSTFEHRGTTLKFPIEFEAAKMGALQKLWTNHLNGLGEFRSKLNLQEQMVDVLKELNGWLSANGIY